MLSVSSVRSAENAWITSSSSTSAICAAFYRAIFNTITTPERIFRSARTARGLVPYNLPRPVISLPSRKLAVCTIAMSVEPPEGKTVLLAPRPIAHHVNFEQGQEQDRAFRHSHSGNAVNVRNILLAQTLRVALTDGTLLRSSLGSGGNRRER
jgi:hypothetical protein